MTADTREFHIGDVLTVTTGVLVSPRNMNGVYDILSFLTGESIYTHQIPRALRECGPILLERYPQLVGVDASSINGPDECRVWLADKVARFGETLPVRPLASREARYDTPVADLIEMVGDPTKILVLEPDPR